MRANLKLVPPSPSVGHSRPFATYYYGENAREDDWSRIGRAGSLRGAIRAAVCRVVDGGCASAIIHDEDGVVVCRVGRKGHNIHVLGVFS